MNATPQQSQSDFAVFDDSGTSRVSSVASPTEASLPATLPFVALSALVDPSMLLSVSSPSRSSVTGESWGCSTAFFSASTTSDGNFSSVTFVSAVYYFILKIGKCKPAVDRNMIKARSTNYQKRTLHFVFDDRADLLVCNVPLSCFC